LVWFLTRRARFRSGDGERVSRQDLVTGESETYGYDRDSRLVKVTTTADGLTATTFTATYDGVGNLESKTGLGGTVDYTYGSNPDQVASVSVTGAEPGVTAGSLDYDAAGRMTAGLGLTVEYDGRGLATEVTTGTGTGMFQYTPDGGLESEVVSGASGSEAVYEMDGGLVRAVVRADGVDSYRESVVVGGETIGILTSRTNGTSGFTYLFRGALGSVEAYANAAGAEEGAVSYTPFGRLRSEADWERLEPGESLSGT
jgi:YD repeat-containing protein